MSKLGVIADGISRNFSHAAKVLSRAGLRFVELQFIGEKKIGDLDAGEVAMVKSVTLRHGLSVSCLSHDLFSRLAVGTTEIGDAAYRAEMDAMRRVIANARALDADLVRLMCFRKEMILFGSNGAERNVVAAGAWDKFVALMEPPVRLAEAEGIRVVVETSNKGMVNSAFLGRKLVDAIDSHALKILWDPANALYAGERPYPEGYEALAGGHLGHMHIKDIVARPREASVECRALGDGQMGPHLSAIAAALERDGYDGCISLESIYCPDGGTFEDGFNASIDRFKSIFG
jgi:sugar phosphate isomerase/epimerase